MRNLTGSHVRGKFLHHHAVLAVCRVQRFVEEVEVRRSPTFRIRQEYSEAFDAIDKFGLDGNVFINILNFDPQKDKPSDIESGANSLRKVIEKMMSQFMAEDVIPFGIKLSQIPHLLSGNDKFNKKTVQKDSDRYSSADLMPEALYNAFTHFMDYTQDGSHEGLYLKLQFSEYLKSTGDIYIVKALAIVCLDIIKWSSSFYDKYLPYHPFPFKPFEAQVEELVTVDGKEGAIVYDSDRKKYFIEQPPSPKYRYYVGTKVRIDNRQSTTKQFGDYYCRATNLDVKS